MKEIGEGGFKSVESTVKIAETVPRTTRSLAIGIPPNVYYHIM